IHSYPTRRSSDLQGSASLFNNQSSETLSTDKEQKENKPAVNPAEQKPAAPKVEKSAKVQPVTPSALPLGAKVSVLETGSSTNTDPTDGSYSLMSSAGTFTVKAETYGFESEEKQVTVEADEISTVNLTLEERANTTLIDTVTVEATGTPIDGV